MKITMSCRITSMILFVVLATSGCQQFQARRQITEAVEPVLAGVITVAAPLTPTRDIEFYEDGLTLGEAIEDFSNGDYDRYWVLIQREREPDTYWPVRLAQTSSARLISLKDGDVIRLVHFKDTSLASLPKQVSKLSDETKSEIEFEENRLSVTTSKLAEQEESRRKAILAGEKEEVKRLNKMISLSESIIDECLGNLEYKRFERELKSPITYSVSGLIERPGNIETDELETISKVSVSSKIGDERGNLVLLFRPRVVGEGGTAKTTMEQFCIPRTSIAIEGVNLNDSARIEYNNLASRVTIHNGDRLQFTDVRLVPEVLSGVMLAEIRKQMRRTAQDSNSPPTRLDRVRSNRNRPDEPGPVRDSFKQLQNRSRLFGPNNLDLFRPSNARNELVR